MSFNDCVNFSNDVIKLGAIVLLNSTRGKFESGLGVNSIGFLGSITFSGMSSLAAGFSGSGGFTFEWLPLAQPGKLKNWVKSVDFLLQHDQPL